MKKTFEKSPMLKRIEEEKIEKIRKILMPSIYLVVLILTCLGLIGFIFMFSFFLSFLIYLFTGEPGLGLQHWLPGLMMIFLIFLKFPKINKFWDVLMLRKTSF